MSSTLIEHTSVNQDITGGTKSPNPTTITPLIHLDTAHFANSLNGGKWGHFFAMCKFDHHPQRIPVATVIWSRSPIYLPAILPFYRQCPPRASPTNTMPPIRHSWCRAYLPSTITNRPRNPTLTICSKDSASVREEGERLYELIYFTWADCQINGTFYAEGSAIISSSFCEYCYCIR